jgi:hypothetical protein
LGDAVDNTCNKKFYHLPLSREHYGYKGMGWLFMHHAKNSKWKCRLKWPVLQVVLQEKVMHLHCFRNWLKLMWNMNLGYISCVIRKISTFSEQSAN